VWAIETLGQWLLLPAAFRVGIRAGSVELPADSLPGLSEPRRDGSLSLVYRVLSSGAVCVFRRRWVGWYQSPLQTHGVASWSAGRLRVTGNYTIGPLLGALGLLLVFADAMAGFVRQGEPVHALVVGTVGLVGVAVIGSQLASQRMHFRDMAQELLADLRYPPGSAREAERRGRRTRS
jgi:hypothetical protein